MCKDLTIIPALKRESSMSEASLVYRTSSRTARATQRNPVLSSPPSTSQKREKEKHESRQRNQVNLGIKQRKVNGTKKMYITLYTNI